MMERCCITKETITRGIFLLNGWLKNNFCMTTNNYRDKIQANRLQNYNRHCSIKVLCMMIVSSVNKLKYIKIDTRELGIKKIY